jgi:replicative DNA helicase
MNAFSEVPGSSRVVVEATRRPPQSLQAEQAVLGALLLDNSAWDRITDILVEADFYYQANRTIFRHTVALIESNRPADALTLMESLGEDDVTAIGGGIYIASLSENVFSIAHVRSYAETVKRHSKLRQALAVASTIFEKAMEPSADADKVLELAESALYRLQDGTQRDEMRSVDEILIESVEHIDKMYQMEGEKLAGIPTGLIDLDKMTGGFEPGDLIVVGARPSMGKTSLVLGITEHVAKRRKGAVAFFSLEMSGMQLGLRQIAANAKKSMHALRTGAIEKTDWAEIVDAVGRLQGLPIYIDDRPAVSLSHVRTRCRRLARRTKGLALICVDYLTLMDSQGDSRDERVGALAKGLKQIAKEFGVPVIALAQLNRSCEQRNDKRPMMSDLRESGEVEQAADIVMFVYRDEVYDKSSSCKGVAELIIGKQRNGPTGTVFATFLGPTMTFVNIDPSWQRPEPPPPQTHVTSFRDFRTRGDYKSLAAGEPPL